MAREHAVRLLRDDELGGYTCSRGNMGAGICEREPVYMTEVHWHNGKGPCVTQLAACAGHAAAFAMHQRLELPMPVRVLVRRREDVQQLRDVVARLARQQREMQRFQAEFAERLAGLFSLSSPSQRQLPLGMDPGDHRQHLWGDVRGSASG